MTSPKLETDRFFVDDMSYNETLLGDADIRSFWDNDNKFVFFTTSNNDIAYVKNNNLYTKNVNKNEDIIVTLEDKYTHINSSLSFTILDSGYTINDEIESSNYSKDKTFSTKSNDFNYFYDVKFENEFVFSQTINVQNVKEDSYFGYALSSNKELNRDSILISLSKENNAFNIEVFSYNTKGYNEIISTKIL